NRHIPLRCLYGVLLLAMLFLQYSNRFPGRFDSLRQLFQGESLPIGELPKFAESFFYTFLAAQFTAVFLITPAYTAGAIAEEREHRTLDYLLATGLSDREIVVGTMAARLANLSLLVLAGLPVLCLTQFLGGV